MKSFDCIETVTSIGGGPIGGGWAAYFLAKGLKVKAYLHSKDEVTQYNDIIEAAWVNLLKIGVSEGSSLDNLQISFELDECLSNVDFVQESVPESLEVKQSLYSKIDDLLDHDIAVASSTSGLLISDITAKCSTSHRAVVGHPFNPPYLLPLVEIVGGSKTKSEILQWVNDFYSFFGKVPIILKKEIPGFIATRLQEALWREALHMVKNDEASPEQIDLALINGPAPRMAYQGQCMAFHVACGEGGMATCLDQFGPALKLPWTRLKAPDLDQDLRNKMVDGCKSIAGTKNFKQLVNERDAAIVAVLNALKK